MSEWQSMPLRRIASIIDGPHATPKKVGHGPWYLSISSLDDGRLDLSKSAHLSELDYDRWARRAAPRRGDTLFSYETRIGEAAHWDRSDPAVLGRRMAILRPNAEVVHPRFLTYAFLSPQFQEVLRARTVHGATVERLLIGEMGDWPMELPPMPVQRRIVRLLGTLDDLIDRDVQLLNQIDQTFMATWTAVARECPSGAFGDHVSLWKGVSYKGSFLADSGIPLINLGNFGLDGSFREDGSKFYQGPVKSDRMLGQRDLVVANTDLTQQRDILARPLLVPYKAATSTHHTFQVRVPAGVAMRAWLYCALRVEPVRRSLIAYATGTTVAALPSDALSSLHVPIPSSHVLSRWWDQAEVLLDATESLSLESQQVKSTRDELLPLLMSGRVAPRGMAS